MLISLLRTKSTVAWLALLVATCISWSLGVDHGVGAGGGHRLTSVLIILVAFFKVSLVGRYFMELRQAPLALRGLFEGYCVAVCGLVLGIYLLA